MRIVRQYWFLILPIIILTAAYSYFGQRYNNLEFRSLSFPNGFRELLLQNNSSRIDPLFGIRRLSGNSGLQDSDLNICDALFRDPASPTVGNDDAIIRIVEFFDYRCPYCKKLSSLITKLRISDRRVRVIYKEWPILGESSELSARAALAAAKQGKYLEFHSRLMRSGFIPTIGYIKGLATDLGLDQSQFGMDMDSDETMFAIQRNVAVATKMGFIGTPSIVVGRTIIRGAITSAQLNSLVEIESSSEQPPHC